MDKGMSEGLAWIMVSGLLLIVVSLLMLALVCLNVRAGRRRAYASKRRAEAAQDRAHAAVVRAQAARDRAGRRTGRARWDDLVDRGMDYGPNVLLLLVLLAPAADRIPYVTM